MRIIETITIQSLKRLPHSAVLKTNTHLGYPFLCFLLPVNLLLESHRRECYTLMTQQPTRVEVKPRPTSSCSPKYSAFAPLGAVHKNVHCQGEEDLRTFCVGECFSDADVPHFLVQKQLRNL